MIARRLATGRVQTTARYAHLASVVKTSAVRVAESLAADVEKPRTVSADAECDC